MFSARSRSNRQRNRHSPEQTQGASENPLSYADVKRLGVFAVQYVDPDKTIDGSRRGVRVTPMYARAGIVKDKDARVLELHLRTDVSLKGLGPQAVRESLGLVAAYTRANADIMQPDEIIGVTDPHLGRVAQRFGFDVHDIDTAALPPIIVGSIDERGGRADRPRKTEDFNLRPDNEIRGYANRRPYSDFGHLVVAHQTVPDFMQRFGVAQEQDTSHPQEAA